MASLHTPPEMEADVRAVAAKTGRDAQAVYEELLGKALAAEKKRAFDQDLQTAHEQILAGDFVTEEESLAGLEE